MQQNHSSNTSFQSADVAFNHADHNASGSAHGSLKSYIIGFVLSLMLTIIPFVSVMHHVFAISATFIIIAVTAIMQLLVQVIFFLHLSGDSKPRWNVIAFIFTVIVVVILVAGSLWIMYNLNYNMSH